MRRDRGHGHEEGASDTRRARRFGPGNGQRPPEEGTFGVAHWADFEAADPELAAFGHKRLHNFGVPLGFLATVRHDDAGPRVHPVSPFLDGGRLYVTIPRSSPKRSDLRSDARYMLHSFPDRQDPEFSIRGRARLVDDHAERASVATACPFAAGVRPDDDVFELDIDRADSTIWMNWAQADTYAVRKRWRAS